MARTDRLTMVSWRLLARGEVGRSFSQLFGKLFLVQQPWIQPRLQGE